MEPAQLARQLTLMDCNWQLSVIIYPNCYFSLFQELRATHAFQKNLETFSNYYSIKSFTLW